MKKDVTERCPICGNSTKVIAIVPTINPGADDGVELRSCDSCGHWFHPVNKTQEELNELYVQASPFVVEFETKNQSIYPQVNKKFCRYIDKWLGGQKRQTRYLEIGLGDGALFKRFQNMGYDCYGVDPGQWVKDDGIFDSIDGIPQHFHFDICVLKDVLEHLLNPIDMMKKIRTFSNDSSVIFCSFPCNDSRSARKYKQRWTMIRPYGHLHYFSFSSASKMFASAGWKIINMQLTSPNSLLEVLLNLKFKQLAHALLKGERDQLYITAMPDLKAK